MADSDINSQLLNATWEGRADTVRDLIQRQGANPNHAHRHDKTPILFAAQYGRLEIVRILGELGADPNLTDDNGATPIYWAALHGHLEVVRSLGKLGADPNLADNCGETAIFRAARCGGVEVVRALGELGADPNHADTFGDTPIFMAAHHGHVDVVCALLEIGADPKIATKGGMTPLDVAVLRDNVRVRRVLETWQPPSRKRIRAELDDKIEEVQIIEMVADFVGPMCDPKRRKAYIARCAQYQEEPRKRDVFDFL